MGFSVVNVKRAVIVTSLDEKALGVPIGGGVPQDGDGDGKYSLPGGEDVIPIPNLPEKVESLWGKVNDDRINSRRERLRKALQGKKLKDVSSASDLDSIVAKRDRRAAMAQAKAIFEHSNLGNDRNVSSKVSKVSFADGPFPAIDISGEFLDSDGNVVGYFERRLFTSAQRNPASQQHPYVYLSQLNLRAKGKDSTSKGIGRDFGMITARQFQKAGFKETRLTAGLRDGPYIWAKEGYDWIRDSERIKFLDALERAAKQVSAPDEQKKYFKTPQEYSEFMKLIETARSQDYDDKQRLTPYAFTLFSGAQDFFKTMTTEDGKPFSWAGKRGI